MQKALTLYVNGFQGAGHPKWGCFGLFSEHFLRVVDS